VFLNEIPQDHVALLIRGTSESPTETQSKRDDGDSTHQDRVLPPAPDSSCHCVFTSNIANMATIFVRAV